MYTCNNIYFIYSDTCTLITFMTMHSLPTSLALLRHDSRFVLSRVSGVFTRDCVPSGCDVNISCVLLFFRGLMGVWMERGVFLGSVEVPGPSCDLESLWREDTRPRKDDGV